jgi:uncharacterized protein (TIGR03067 family)
MRPFQSTRRAFLSFVFAAVSGAALAFRRWSPRRKLIGEWTVAEYICDGKPALKIARDVRVTFAPETMTVWLQLPDRTQHQQSCRYTLTSLTHIDIRNSDDTATFEGVYHLSGDELKLAWDTVGKGRPRTISSPDRFGLNRMLLRRA